MFPEKSRGAENICPSHPEAHLYRVLLALGLDRCRLPHDVVDLPHNGLLKMLR